MKQLKQNAIYIISFMFFILLSASFTAQDYLDSSYSVDLKPKTVYYAFTGELDEYLKGSIGSSDDDQTSGGTSEGSTYKLGDKNDEILKYQLLLYYMDYITFTPDGQLGAATETAIKAYQEEAGISVNGFLDKETMESLDSADIEYTLNKSSDDILNYKLKLYYLGYFDEYPSDEFDKEAEAATEKYQSDKGLSVSGTINAQTRTSLDSEDIEYKKEHQGEEIKSYQLTLKSLGYFEETTDVNGYFGIATETAVKFYQENNNLEETGTLNKETQESLKKPESDQVKAE